MKRILKFSLILFFVLIVLFFALPPLLVKSEVIQGAVIRGLEDFTGGEVSVAKFAVSYFPSFGVELGDARVGIKNRQRVSVRAHKAKIKVRVLPLLWGRTVVDRLEIRDGEAVLEPPRGTLLKKVRLEKIHLKVGPLEPKRHIQVTFQADLEGAEKSLAGKASFTVPQWEGGNWNAISIEGQLRLKDFELNRLQYKASRGLPIRIKSGRLKGGFNFHKKAGEANLIFKGPFELSDFVYEVKEENRSLTAPAFHAAWDFEVAWNPVAGELTLTRSALRSGVGRIEAKGVLRTETGELRDVRVSATDIALEPIPHHWIPLKEAIPFNIGFSGQGNLELSLSGTWDHLTLHANSDLTPALFTYGRYFVKPKDFPLNLAFDFLVKEGKILSGDFSLRLKDTTAKGTLTDVDLRTGTGQVNLITNKFQLSGWEELLPPLAKYKIQGETKLLVNWAGPLQRLHEAQMMLNWTLDGGEVASPEGAEIRNVHISLDYGPMLVSMKEARFEIGDSSVFAELTVDTPRQAPRAVAKISSPHVEPSEALAILKKIASPWLGEEAQAAWDKQAEIVLHLFPLGEAFEDFFLEAEYSDRKYLVKNLMLEAYGGKGQLQAGLDLVGKPPSLWADAEIDRLSLARFISRGGEERKLVDGNFFSKAHFMSPDLGKGPWQDSLVGEGTFSITNGEFHTFDLLGAVGKITELAGVNRYVSGTTPFDDVRSRFVLKEGRVKTEKLALISRDLSIEADGDVSLAGVLNYRLSVYLSGFLTDQVLGSMRGKSEGGEKRLGPIPLLLAGPIAQPDLRADPALLAQLLEQLIKKKVQKVLRNFPPEELFLGRRTSS